MSSHAVIHFLLGLPFQLLLQSTIAQSAIIPQPPGIAPKSSGNDIGHCVDYEDWLGNGIIKSDCADAISEFFRTNVQPRGGQEYEFYALGGPRTSRFPTVLTPRKYDYGTCVIVIAMLDIFSRGQLPGDTPRHARAYQRADAGTFNDIYRAAVSLSSKCVNKKVETEAGWSSTGAANSIGVFILRSGSVLDRVLRGSAPTISSVNNQTAPSIELFKAPNATYSLRSK